MRMFDWAFSPANQYKGYVKPDPQVIDGPFAYGGLRLTPLPVVHGSVETVGYLFECPGARSVAYIPDVKEIPDETMERIRGVDVLVIDALRAEPHPTHFSVAEALDVIEYSGAGQAWLTHLGHENDHASLEAGLPEGVRVAWDGLRIDL